MGRPGRIAKALFYIVLLSMIALVTLGVTIVLDLKSQIECQPLELLAPVAILVSAGVGALVALNAIASNRREYVRKNTLETLNNLEMDCDYWEVANKLIARIEKVRSREREGTRITAIDSFPEVTETDVDGIEYYKVLRRLEWLIESAYLGHIDWQELAYRKAVMIDYIHRTCKKLIENKRYVHQNRYSKKTVMLVYQHLGDENLVKSLLAEAEFKAEKPNAHSRFKVSIVRRCNRFICNTLRSLTH